MLLTVTKYFMFGLQTPTTTEERLAINEQFATKWNFPNCIGALDGKHVVITALMNSGSDYFNYKHTFSVVLLALVDADYKFVCVDTGTNGRVSDGGVYAKSSMARALEKNALNFPSDGRYLEGLSHSHLLS